MIEGPFNKNENLKIKASIATENDWEDCKRLRIQEISGEDSEMFGYIKQEDIEKEENKNKEDWKRRLTSEKQFSTLIHLGNKAVGFGNAIDKGNDLWRIRWGYTDKEFRGLGIQKANIALRLKEILKRGGKKVESGVVAKNMTSLSNLVFFGFKISEKHTVEEIDEVYSYTMVIDLTDEEVIKNINNFVL